MKKTVTITLRPIDQNNRETCPNLEVSEDQKNLLPGNRHSIDELQSYPQTKAVAIYNEECMIGFATYGIPEEKICPKIFRLMIDRNHQGKGYGRAALAQIVLDLFILKLLNNFE